jgi:hypothetical protein
MGMGDAQSAAGADQQVVTAQLCREAMRALREEFTKRMDQLDKDVNGNGQPGMRQNLESCKIGINEIQVMFRERDRSHKQILALLSLLIVLLGAVLAIPPAVTSIRELLKSDLHWPKIQFTYDNPLDAHLKNRETLANKRR